MKTTVKSPLRDILARNMRLLRAEAGVNRTYLSAVERSEQNISLDNIYKIAVALNVPAWTLLQEAQTT